MSMRCLTNRIWKILPDNARLLITVLMGVVSESTVCNNYIGFVKIGFVVVFRKFVTLYVSNSHLIQCS